MTRTHLARSLLRTCLILLASPIAPAAATDAEMVVGLVGPMTGTFSRAGAEIAAGFRQALADVNASGGVLGAWLRPTIGDDACDRDRAVEQARRMVGAGARVVVGHVCSAAAVAAAPVYAAARIVLISPAARHPDFTDRRAGRTVFRLAGREDQQGLVAGRFLAARYAGKRIAIFHDRTDYGRGLATAVKVALSRTGQRELLFAPFKAGEKDYGKLVRAATQANADVVYLGGHATEVALIVRQMRDVGLAAAVMAGDAIAGPDFQRIAGRAVEGVLMTFPPDARRRAEASGIIQHLRATGTEPQGHVLHAYAALEAWSQAAREAGSDDGPAVAAILQQRTFDTALGRVAFDHKGDVLLPAYAIHAWTAAGQYQQTD